MTYSAPTRLGTGWNRSGCDCIRPNKIVYCKDGTRPDEHEHTWFTFLGFTFRPRPARRKNGARFLSFTPAISTDALKKISREVRSWRLHQRITHTFTDLAKAINAIVAGWMRNSADSGVSGGLSWPVAELKRTTMLA